MGQYDVKSISPAFQIHEQRHDTKNMDFFDMEKAYEYMKSASMNDNTDLFTDVITECARHEKSLETFFLASDKGHPIMVNIGEQRASIKMAKEMLEALK